MKIAFFDMMDYEKSLCKAQVAAGVNIFSYSKPLTTENVFLTKGCEAISINSHSCLGYELLKCLQENGVQYISTRTVGYEHIDIDSATKMGMRVFASRTATSNVSEFTVMMILCVLRRVNVLFEKTNKNDFSLDGICGIELKNCIVGIIGTGKIGSKVIHALSGFGCTIYAYDISHKEQLKSLCKYVELDSLLKESDIISLHVPLNPQTYHMLNKKTFSLMKDGVIIVNTARGALIRGKDLLNALKMNKVSYAAIDVLYEDEQYVHSKHQNDTSAEFKLLESMIENNRILYTPHCAFFTKEAIKEIFFESLNFDRPYINNIHC